MIRLEQRTYKEINIGIAERMTALRKRKKISQKILSEISGVSFGSVRRFEKTGDISLQSLTKIAIALQAENELEKLFTEVPFASIEEIINGQN